MPECKEGDIAERRSKQGRTFYSCGRYPDCNSLFGANLRANPAPNAALFSSSRPKAKSAVQAKNVNLKKNKMTKLMQSKIFLSLLTILCLFL